MQNSFNEENKVDTTGEHDETVVEKENAANENENRSEWGDITEERTFWDDSKQWIKAIALAVIIAYLLNVFVFERARVDGDSMKPTLYNTESLFEYKLCYYYRKPARGEIVIFEYDTGKYESKWMPFDKEQVNYVKRIIGLPGETIDIRDGKVYIDGKQLIEPYLAEGTLTTVPIDPFDMEAEVQYPYTIPEGQYFVMGDNRPESKDSRYIGAVSKSRIRGKVEFVMLPVDDIRSVVHTQPYFAGEENPNEAE